MLFAPIDVRGAEYRAEVEAWISRNGVNWIPRGETSNVASAAERRAERARELAADLGVEDVAIRLGVSIATVYRYLAQTETRSGQSGRTRQEERIDARQKRVEELTNAGCGATEIAGALGVSIRTAQRARKAYLERGRPSRW